MVKHIKVMHSKQSSTNAWPDKQKSARFVTVQQDHQEEWDKDPEISLECDQRKKENEKGRLFKKSTEPMPVIAPKMICIAGCFGARGASSSACATEIYDQLKAREEGTKAKESASTADNSEKGTSMQ